MGKDLKVVGDLWGNTIPDRRSNSAKALGCVWGPVRRPACLEQNESWRVWTLWDRYYLVPILQTEKLSQRGTGWSKVTELVSARGSAQTPGL